MFCYNCGKELESNMRFCPFCGTGVVSTGNSPEVKAEPDNQEKQETSLINDNEPRAKKYLKR